MTTPTDNPTANGLTVAQLTKASAALHVVFYQGRSAYQNASGLERCERDNRDRPDGSAQKVEDLKYAAYSVVSIVAAVEACAEQLPALRALAACVDGADKLPTIADAGCAIVVQYRPPTDSGASKWVATYKRDAETTFRARSHFTYKAEDNEGCDNAAAACLAKFEAYCNDLPADISHAPKVKFTLTSRASLGRGAYAYTFRRS